MTGIKHGVPKTEAIPGPLDGTLLSDTVISSGTTHWYEPGVGEIECITIKALAANTDTIYITGTGANTDGFALAKSETVSIATNHLEKVKVWIPTIGDGFCWLAIQSTRI